MRQYIVDAFTDRLFAGNQAAVCVSDEWPSDELMTGIALENNLSETAFAVREGVRWRLRWFTPGGEIDFCGHATLATAYVLFRFYEKVSERIEFVTQVGAIGVERCSELFELDFPAYRCRPVDVTDAMESALGIKPLEAYLDRDLMLVLPDANSVRTLRPNQQRLLQLDGLLTIVTAVSDDPAFDCVSRVFAPKLAVEEDPVTGSAHCMIAPYWRRRLKKDNLACFQASRRTGTLYARCSGDRVIISGKAVLFSEGELYLNGVV